MLITWNGYLHYKANRTQCWSVLRAQIPPTNWSKTRPHDILQEIHLRASAFFCSLAERDLIVSFKLSEIGITIELAEQTVFTAYQLSLLLAF